ncbi:HAD family hydrolase [Kitasatospora sp. NPDC089509]|uniref:HAD family hydrolase n=1 Tax=Kitasatospora sp. NPDC089509 TaxID=3364079 RepID=UPI0038228772
MPESVAPPAAGPVPSRPPRAVLFDAGLTLIHPDGDILVEELTRCEAQPATPVAARRAVTALQLAAEARHLPLPAGLAGDEKVGTLWATLLGTDRERTVRAFHRAAARPDLYRVLDPGARGTLSALQAKDVVLGVVSNSEGTVRDDLDVFGLLPFFRTVVDSTVVGIEKPQPGIFHAALSELGIPGEDCWYVGDGLVNDVLGALGAGFGAGVLLDRFDCYGHLPGILRITCLDALVALVDRAAREVGDGPR